MQAVRSAGVLPVLRVTGAGVLSALLALLVFVRGLFELVDPVAPDVALVGGGALIVFAAAALGGAAGAWQAALAGVPTRREIVLVGALCTGVACAAASLVLSISQSVDPGWALLELAMVAAGAGAGAWALPTVALTLARLRGTRGQTSAEYMGALLLVAIIVAALLASGVPAQIGAGMSSAVKAIAGGGASTAQGGARGDAPGQLVVDPTGDDDGDGLNNEEEAALGTDPDVEDSDGDGVSDVDEFSRGTDPLRAWSRSRRRTWARHGSGSGSPRTSGGCSRSPSSTRSTPAASRASCSVTRPAA